jgi:colanic acid biosynthesis glycosyl transferase WcaI
LKILLIHQHYFPEMSGTARRAKELAESFVNQGYFVTIITSYPRDYRSIPGESFKSTERIAGVNVIRVNNIFEVKKNPFLRMISYFSFVLLSFNLGLKLARGSDIVISIAPISSGIVGALIQLISKKHHHFDIPDILPDLGISAGMIKNKFVIYILRKLEYWVYKHSDSISTCTKGQMKNINQKGVSMKKLCCIPDWINDSFFRVNHQKYYEEVSQTYNYPNKIIISFVGNIGALQKPSVFIEVMELLENNKLNNFVLLFFGDGIMLNQIKKMVIAKNLNNVEFIGKVKREYIPAIMNMSDILVTNYVPDEHLDLYIPGKLFEYAISQKPIVIGARGDAKEFIEKYNLGIAVKPSCVSGFMDAILKISNGSYKHNPDTAQFTVEYSIENIVKKYNKIFNKYINIQA